MSLKQQVNQFIKYAEEDRISQASAECAYYVILSFIPLVIMILTIIQYMNINPKEVLEAISIIFPTNVKNIVEEIIIEVYSKSIGTISVSLVFTIISAIQGLTSFINEIQQINNIERKNI